MRFFKFIIIIGLFFTSCKASKNATNTTSGLKKLSAKKILKKHVSKDFDKKTLDAKLKVNFKNDKQNVGLSVRMKIKKDEVIWLKGTKLITVFKAKITPDKVSFYSPYYKNYIEGDFKMLEKIFGVAVNFKQFQSMLMGQVMFTTHKKHTAKVVDAAYELSPKTQEELFDVFYQINASHYKLNKQSLVNSLKEQRLDIVYPSYKNKSNSLFPEKILIEGKKKNKQSTIDIIVRSIVFDEEVTMPFKIPEGYKEIQL